MAMVWRVIIERALAERLHPGGVLALFATVVSLRDYRGNWEERVVVSQNEVPTTWRIIDSTRARRIRIRAAQLLAQPSARKGAYTLGLAGVPPPRRGTERSPSAKSHGRAYFGGRGETRLAVLWLDAGLQCVFPAGPEDMGTVGGEGGPGTSSEVMVALGPFLFYFRDG